MPANQRTSEQRGGLHHPHGVNEDVAASLFEFRCQKAAQESKCQMDQLPPAKQELGIISAEKQTGCGTTGASMTTETSPPLPKKMCC